MSGAQLAAYVVETCNEGTDWCVRDATDDDPVDERHTHADAVEACKALCRENPGSRWYDFSEG